MQENTHKNTHTNINEKKHEYKINYHIISYEWWFHWRQIVLCWINTIGGSWELNRWCTEDKQYLLKEIQKYTNKIQKCKNTPILIQKYKKNMFRG